MRSLRGSLNPVSAVSSGDALANLNRTGDDLRGLDGSVGPLCCGHLPADGVLVTGLQQVVRHAGALQRPVTGNPPRLDDPLLDIEPIGQAATLSLGAQELALAEYRGLRFGCGSIALETGRLRRVERVPVLTGVAGGHRLWNAWLWRDGE